MLPSEFISEVSYVTLEIERILGQRGRLVDSSKTCYTQKHPNNIVLFNANIFFDITGKVWYGDIDLTLDLDKLREIARKFKTDVVILGEHDGRFELHNRSDYDQVFAFKVTPSGDVVVGSKWLSYVVHTENGIAMKGDEEQNG